ARHKTASLFSFRPDRPSTVRRHANVDEHPASVIGRHAPSRFAELIASPPKSLPRLRLVSTWAISPMEKSPKPESRFHSSGSSAPSECCAFRASPPSPYGERLVFAESRETVSASDATSTTHKKKGLEGSA